MTQRRNGVFITLEGLEGAGKSTAVKAITEWFLEQNKTPVLIREPGGTAVAEAIRELVKFSRDDELLSPETEVLLMYAARSQLLQEKIRPALDAGQVVICDRHDLSTLAYQGYGREVDLSVLQTLGTFVLGELIPDMTFYLDIPPELGLERVYQRNEQIDRFEQEGLQLLNKVRAGYLSLAKDRAEVILVDATESASTVAQAISDHLSAEVGFV